MSIDTKIPAVLQQPHGNSLSIERVLKLAIDLIDMVPWQTPQIEDRCNTCQDDLRDLLRAIDRG